jgi:endonuclease YncB( thermonuclease family)
MVLSLIVVTVTSIAAVRSEDRGGLPACRSELIASGIATAVLDGRTLSLDDGREVRLAAIEVPRPDESTRGNAATAATAALRALVAGRTIQLRKAPQGRDRYGRLLAQVFLSGEAGPWVQGEMVALGHARVAARVGDPGCAAELLGRERAARAAKLGLWADPYYDMRRAEEPALVLGDQGRFTIVEGSVLSVRESGGTIYVNFGRRWSEDFTVTVAKRSEGLFSAAGLDLKQLAGRRVRIRGWVSERGGPWIEATRPEQIELVELN